MRCIEETAAETLAWAQAHGVEAARPAGPIGGFRDDVRGDFGRLVERTPVVVLRPRDQAELIACVAFLAEARIPWKTRGAGHCAGGHALIEGGAVIDTRHLARIVVDDPDADELTVEGGAWWLRVMEHLHPQGRRPWVLTDNLRTSIAGTLALGGFGDRTHLAGLQIESVTRLTLVTPDAAVHRLVPGDPLFAGCLGGSGRLGVLAEIGLRTIHRPRALTGSVIEWPSIGHFLDDAQRIRADGRYEFLRAVLDWRTQRVAALAGHFSDVTVDDRAALVGLRPDRVRPLPAADRIAHAHADPIATWTYACPALELALPLPDGLDALESILAQVIGSGLPAHLPLGSALVVFAPPVDADARFPLAPYPRAATGLMLVLRPQLADRAAALRWLPTLRRLAAEALDAGGRLYEVGVDLGLVPEDARLTAWSRAVDPLGLCRSGVRPVL